MVLFKAIGREGGIHMTHLSRVRLLLAVLASASFISVVNPQDKPTQGQNSSDTTTTSYKCTGGIKLKAEFTQGEPGSAKVTKGSATWDLPQVRSASGAKYSNGKVTFWSKGTEGIFQRKGKTYKCTPQN